MYLEKPCCQPLSRRFHTHRNRPREPANLTLAVTNRTLRAIDTGAVPVRFAFRARRCRHTLGCWPSRFRRDLSVALAYRLIRYAFAFRIARPLSCHCHWVPSISGLPYRLPLQGSRLLVSDRLLAGRWRIPIFCLTIPIFRCRIKTVRDIRINPHV